MAPVNFWTQDGDGERWLINGPELVIRSNRSKKKGKKNMYMNRKPKHGTKAWMAYIRGLRRTKNPKRKHHAKRNMYSAGEIANRPRTRTVTRYVHNKRGKRNMHPTLKKGLLGFAGLPAVEQLAGAFAGLAVPPILNYFVAPYLPTGITSTKFGKYAVQAAEVWVPSWLVQKFVNRNVGTTMMTVGFGKLLWNLANEVAPNVFMSGMGYQPMLGLYPAARPGFPVRQAVPLLQSPMIASTPDRLNPAARM